MVNVDGVINAGYKNIAPSSLSLLILYMALLYWNKYPSASHSHYLVESVRRILTNFRERNVRKTFVRLGAIAVIVVVIRRFKI